MSADIRMTRQSHRGQDAAVDHHLVRLNLAANPALPEAVMRELLAQSA
jgi:hypothetical protein